MLRVNLDGLQLGLAVKPIRWLVKYAALVTLATADAVLLNLREKASPLRPRCTSPGGGDKAD